MDETEQHPTVELPVPPPPVETVEPPPVLTEPPVPGEPLLVIESTEPGGPTAPPRRSRRKWLVIAVALLVVAGAITGVAIAVGGGSGKQVKPAPASPAAALTLLAPTSLSADVHALSVTLTWLEPTGGKAVERFTINRDGGYLSSVVAPTSTFTDGTVIPGRSYTYEVSAVAGDETSSSITESVKTPVPSIAQARLSGDFNVAVKLVSQTGFSSYGPNFTTGWHFKPKCAEGPCDVVWTDLNEKSFKATLDRSKATYSGSDTGDFGSTCGKTSHNSVLTVKFHVTKARAVDGEWRAVKLAGTITQYDAPQLGCVTGRANLSFTANLLT
jgi:hypothetical protein